MKTEKKPKPRPKKRPAEESKPSSGRWAVLVAAAAIVIVGVLVYLNSLDGAFVLDDEFSIQRNPRVRDPWNFDEIFGGSRPVVIFSLAVNFALGGLKTWGYHVFNVAVHVLAALALFGVVRRTLLTDRLRKRFGPAATPLAAAAAMIWMVHPLQTNAVTYVVQRAEAMMGLCYLLTMYCGIRAALADRRVVQSLARPDGKRPSDAASFLWSLGAVAACLISVGIKEVIVTAPFVLLVYDWVFLSGSLRHALRRRWGLYACLAATWLALAKQMMAADTAAAGFSPRAEGVWEYAATQFGVILHYLRLSVWPSGLCLDYWWPVARTAGQILPGAVVVVLLLAGTAFALSRKPALGFLGVWYFVILAPTSSIVPIADLAFEHRVYLSLAAEAVLFVCVVYAAIEALLGKAVPSARKRRLVALGACGVLAAGVVAALGAATVARNEVYKTEESVWRDIVAKRARNPRARNNLGKAIYQAGRIVESMQWYQRALDQKADYADPHYNLGVAYANPRLRKEGLSNREKIALAIQHYNTAIEINPELAPAHNNLGTTYAMLKRYDEALKCYAEAIKVAPQYVTAYSNMGVALSDQGRTDEALTYFLKAIEIEPKYVEGRLNLGLLYVKRKEIDKALAEYRKAAEIDPRCADAHNQIGALLVQRGKLDEAMASFEKAVAAAPNHAGAHFNMGVLLAKRRETDEAIKHYQEAVRIQPRYIQARFNLGRLLGAKGQIPQAVEEISQVIKLKPDSAEAHNEMGNLLARARNIEGAIDYYTKAISLNAKHAGAHYNLATIYSKQGKGRMAIAYFNTALKLNPRHIPAMNDLAWLLATSPDDSVRNGAHAVKLAEQVCRVTQNKQPLFLDTLAAAYAELGRFDLAVNAMRRAIDLAANARQIELTVELQKRLRLYQDKKRYRRRPGAASR